MRRELKIKLLPNNQVSLFTQWVTHRSEERYSCAPDYSREPEWKKEYYRSGRARFERERMQTHEIQRIPFYKADGSISFRLLRVEKERPAPAPAPADSEDDTATLDIIKKSQRAPRSSPGWGMKNRAKKFTNRSGQKIREVGAMMDKSCEHSTEQCGVTTLTLPANYSEAFDVIARYSGYIINRLFQIIRRSTPIDPKWFFVWEFQKRGALHLHIAHFSFDPADSQMVGSQLIEKWHEILCDVSEKSQCCLFTSKEKDRCTLRQFHQHHTQPMYKSCGAYFSKYASKSEGSKGCGYVAKFSEKYPPSRFWGSSKPLKDMCREFSYEEILAIGELIEERHKEILELILRYNPVKFSQYEWKKEIIDSHGWKVVVSEGRCESFYLQKELYFNLLAALKTEGQSLG